MLTSVRSTKDNNNDGAITHTTRFSEKGTGRTEQPAKFQQRQARTDRKTQTQVLTWARKCMADLKSERKHKGHRLMNMSYWVLSKLRVLKKRM